MSLAPLLGEDTKTNGIEVSPERIKNNLDKYQHIIAYWRMYPDRLVDHYCAMNPNNKFHFYWFQRLMLRAIMRHKYTYMVFCRAYSKSFVGVLGMMLKAILYPGIKIFTVSEGKEQSAAILSSKLTEICTLIPALQKEIIWDNRGSLENSRQTKDTVVYVFKNGSHIENVQANDKARGRRYHSGNLEEAICLPQDMLEQVIIPMLNVPRSVNGQVDPNEVVNQSQCFITSAGFKNTYSYNRLVEMLCQSVAEPRKAFVIGGDYRVPVRFGLFSKDFLKDLKVQGTFNAATFEREYCSK